MSAHLLNILHVSTFSPTPCGIATYAEDLIANLVGTRSALLTMDYDGAPSSGAIWRTLAIQSPSAYDEAIQAINKSEVDVVSLQHEFGIYGGPDGELVTRLVSGIAKPIVSTFHTTSSTLSPKKSNIIKCLIDNSDAIVVLSDESASQLGTQFGAPAKKVRVIRHGIPFVEFTTPSQNGLRHRLNCDLLFVSAGHMRPSKGYEVALSALARFKKLGIPFRYLIIGTSQPQWDTGRLFPQQVDAQICELGLQEEVVWVRRYLGLAELLYHIQAADIGLVTYTEPDQISSGILPMMLGCGRPIVATKFDAARSVAKCVSGIYLAEINDPDSVCDRIQEAVGQRERQSEIMRLSYAQTRPWLWQHAAASYREVFEQSAQ